LTTSEPAKKQSAKSSFTIKSSLKSSKSQKAGNPGIKGGFILRGGKKTLRKKRRKKQKNKKVTRKRFI